MYLIGKSLLDERTLIESHVEYSCIVHMDRSLAGRVNDFDRPLSFLL